MIYDNSSVYPNRRKSDFVLDGLNGSSNDEITTYENRDTNDCANYIPNWIDTEQTTGSNLGDLICRSGLSVDQPPVVGTEDDETGNEKRD